jgi:outer membrane protein
MTINKIKFGFLIATSLSVLFCGRAFASDAAPTEPAKRILSLEDCIKEGIANYQGIKVAEFDKVWAQDKLKEARTARFLPQFTATNLFGPIPDVPEGYGPPDFLPYHTDFSEWNIFYKLKIEAFQPLYTFGKIANLVNAATNGVAAKELQIKIEKRDLVHKIKSVYFGLVMGYSSLDLMNEVEEKVESAKKRVEKLLSRHSAEVTDLDLMKLKVFDADLERRYVDVKSDMDTGKRALMVLFGKAPDNGIDIKDNNIAPVDVEIKPIEEYYRLAEENRSELKQMQAAVKIKESMMKVAKADFFPTLFLGAQFDYGVAPGRKHFENPYLFDRFNTLSGGAALGMSFNLNYFLTNSRYRQTKADYNKIVAQSEMARNGVFLEIRESWEDMKGSKEQIDITKEGFKNARSWMTSSYLAFDMGTLSTKDLIEAFVAYTKTKVEYFASIFNFNMATSKLSKATDTEISRISY